MTLIENLAISVVSLTGMKWRKHVQKFQMKIFVWL